jgi:hypothetical protein
MELTKRQIKVALGIETDADLSRFFGIGRWAVGQWQDDQPIPALRQYEAKAKRPDLFNAGNKKARTSKH